MATNFKQTFSAETPITTTGFNALANNGTHYCTEVDNSTTLYDEVILEIKVGGTAAAGAYVDVRILASIDGGGGGDFSSWTAPYLLLPAIDMSVDNPVAHFRFIPPQRWKFAALNKTGAALDVGSASFQGVTYTGTGV